MKIVDGSLIVTYTDGTSFNVGMVQGERGPPGPTGVVTVVRIDAAGKEISRDVGVLSGSTVTFVEKRFLIKGRQDGRSSN